MGLQKNFTICSSGASIYHKTTFPHPLIFYIPKPGKYLMRNLFLNSF